MKNSAKALMLTTFAALTSLLSSCSQNTHSASPSPLTSSQRSRVVDFINAQPGMWGDPSVWERDLENQGLPLRRTGDLYHAVVSYIESSPNDQSGWTALKKLNNSLAGQNDQQYSILQQQIQTSTIPSHVRWQHGY